MNKSLKVLSYIALGLGSVSLISCGGSEPVKKTPTKQVKVAPKPKAEPTLDLYLRGSMNDWGTDTPLSLNADGSYSATRSLRRGDYEFKIADSNWSDGLNFGADSGSIVEIGTPILANGASSNNFLLDISDAGDYSFTISVEAWGGGNIVVKQESVAPKKPKKRVKSSKLQAAKTAPRICPKWDGMPVTIDVSKQFKDGEILIDALTESAVKVENGKVSVIPGKRSKGFVLLERKSSVKPTFSWDNATVYFMVTDRFYNGDKSNDFSYGRKPDNDLEIGTFHGGDLAGVTAKLDYIQSTGADVIWITPPFEQIRGWTGGFSDGSYPHYGYHGYWTQDFTKIDANFGTEADLEKLIAEAHKRGIRVLLDVVMNHPGYSTLKDMQELKYGGITKRNPLHKLDAWTDWKPSRGETWHEMNHFKNRGSAAWLKWWGPDWVRADIPRYDLPPNAGEDPLMGSLSGLPDFKTENPKHVNLPDFYANKETNAVNLPNAAVKDYLISWLTDWVRRYGIDGFRVDTAKHVELEVWQELKTASTAALSEWKSNNPKKSIDDRPFWMVAEAWGHNVERTDYFDHGFDATINFSFQSEPSNDALKCFAYIDNTYQTYADELNSDPNFNVMSYLSSHDTLIYFDAVSRSKRRHSIAGAALMMLPGAVQIYYGDESGRSYSDTGTDIVAGTRSDMNWDDIEAGKYASISKMWQQFGQFRQRHIAVGAGSHTKLSSEPYAFARSYNQNGIKDDVVVIYVGKKKKQK